MMRKNQKHAYGRMTGRAILFLLLILIAVLCLIPFLWMLVMSFKSKADIWVIPPSLHPDTLTVDNYVRIWEIRQPSIRVAFMNSALVSCTATLGSLLTCALAAYAFAKLSFRGKGKLFALILATMMVPGQVTMIPMYIIVKQLGWINTLLPLIIPPILTYPYGVFMLRQYFTSIPDSITESAKIDGASQPLIFARLILPMSRPAMITLLLIRFMGIWNNFLTPMIYVNKLEKITLPLYVRNFESAYGAEWNLMMAASCIVILPVLLLYLFAQRYLTEGIMLGGVKG